MRIAYYVSGHGFGHATRVSAIVEAILETDANTSITIVSTAPSYVFNCLAKGASYRYSEVDPVISQPVAYAVDRKQSLRVLRDFLQSRPVKLEEECAWLRSEGVQFVLSDAVFLACAAANRACIPSALITNFTFDSNWSWLASDLPNDTPWAIVANLPDHHHLMEGIPDDPSAYEPLLESDLGPLVEQMRHDYSCADALFLLPGAIPFPSFSISSPLPATTWVDRQSKKFTDQIVTLLKEYREASAQVVMHSPILYPTSIPAPTASLIHSPGETPNNNSLRGTVRTRRIIPAPLIVRHTTPEGFTESRRNEILDSVGIPLHLRDSLKTHILIVSFGGQRFKRPGASGSTSPASGMATPPSSMPAEQSPDNSTLPLSSNLKVSIPAAPTASSKETVPNLDTHTSSSSLTRPKNPLRRSATTFQTPSSSSQTPILGNYPSRSRLGPRPRNFTAPPQMIATPTHLFIPGAPGPVPNPASPALSNGTINNVASPIFGRSHFSPLRRVFQALSPSSISPSSPLPAKDVSPTSPLANDNEIEVPVSMPVPRLLPEGWIAIICGASSDWNAGGSEEHLPEDLFLAPRDIYMPDLMVVGDVLLGKLGYGTCSEAIDSATPFMYVPRPAILEEMGLKLLLDQSGVGIEISREKYESGDWADLVEEAWEKGRKAKEERRVLGVEGRERRMREAGIFAGDVVKWIRESVGESLHHERGTDGEKGNEGSSNVPSVHVVAVA